MKKYLAIIFIIIFNVITLNIFTNNNSNIIDLKKLKERDNTLNFQNIYGNIHSYFKTSDNLLITGITQNIEPTKEDKLNRNKKYYSINRSNKYLDKVGIDNFLEEYDSYKIKLVMPFTSDIGAGYFGLKADNSYYNEELKKYYTEKINENDENYEMYYNITFTVYAQQNGEGTIEYIPYDDSGLDGNDWGNEPYKIVVVDNRFFPDISASINGKKVNVNVIDEYVRHYSKNNFDNPEKIKGSNYSIKYYNNKYYITGIFKKGLNKVSVGLYQYKRSSIEAH